MAKEPLKQHDEYKTARERAQHISEEERMEIDRRQREDPAFIEHTKPEDPSPRPGQLTRDNVNPNIPSGPKDRPLLPDGRVDPNAGGIVDPKSLGMESQEGAPPPKALAPDQQIAPEGEIYGSQYSINEPPGSDVVPDVPDVGPKTTGDPQVKTSKVHSGANADPDDIEDELDQMREEGDVEMRNKSAPKRK